MAGSTDASSAGWGRRVAYLGPDPGLYTWMTPTEALCLAGGLLDLPADETARRASRVLAWTGISLAAAAAPLSRGGAPLQQRTGLAAALIGDPEVLLLDEPLRALDEGERSRMLKLPDRRRTVLLASRHPASEAGHVEQVAYLRGGRVRLIAPIAALERAELPLSHRGIVALAEMEAALSVAPGAATA